MAQFADLLIARGDFAVGAACFDDQYPGDQQTARIVLSVTVEGQFTVQAIVDTGGPWCIIDPEIAEAVDGDPGSEYQPEWTLGIRGIQYRGVVRRMRLSLPAIVGHDLETEAPVFVPTIRDGEPWPHPNFLGLNGFLNCIRFAVDHSDNSFYFGLA